MKMSIHRALGTLKLLEKKIERSTSESFITSYIGDKAPKGFSSVADFESEAKSSYDSVTSLINRRNAIKNAIILSNAQTPVKIAGETYTVAEAIDKKSFIEHEEKLLRSMKKQFQAETNLFERESNNLQRNLDEYLTNNLGAKDVKNLSEEEEVLKKRFLARHEVKLSDPLNLRKKIDDLETKIEDFRNEIDYTLSESNASTSIEVPDTP